MHVLYGDLPFLSSLIQTISCLHWMQVIEAQENMPIAGVVTLYASLLTFTLQVHPDRLDYIDQILVCFF